MDNKERVVEFIAGIIKTGFGIRGVSWLGAGKTYQSENAMIISNQRILFITVPLPRAEKMIAGVDIGMWQFLAFKKQIKEKLNEMINNLSVEQILNSNPKNYFISYEELKGVKIKKFSGNIVFIKKDGKKLRYGIRDKKDLEKMKILFKNYLN